MQVSLKTFQSEHPGPGDLKGCFCPRTTPLIKITSWAPPFRSPAPGSTELATFSCSPQKHMSAVGGANQSVSLSLHHRHGPHALSRTDQRQAGLQPERGRKDINTDIEYTHTHSINHARRVKTLVTHGYLGLYKNKFELKFELPAILCQCVDLQRGCGDRVGGANQSSVGHAHHHLDLPLTQHRLGQTRAAQYPTHTEIHVHRHTHTDTNINRNTYRRMNTETSKEEGERGEGRTGKKKRDGEW